MMRLELVDQYGHAPQGCSNEHEMNAGTMEINPEVFGWPYGWRIRCTVAPSAAAPTAPAEGTPE
jgi:hypothetical protein